MTRRILYLLIILGCSSLAWAQQKWVKKARKAQINLVTYNATGQLLHSTNGFFIDDAGTAFSDYHSFRSAARAVAIDEAGKEWPVVAILGANSLYDVVKLQVNIPKNASLTLSSTPAQQGEEVYLMPYLSNKSGLVQATTVAEVAAFNGSFNYYTLPTPLTDKAVSCPLMNAQGQVIGLLQKAATANDTNSYAVSADFVQSLCINALSATATDYREILIKKALPQDASQAHSFIYLLGTRDMANYPVYIDDYIVQFPAEANGYIMKAEWLAAQQRYPEADDTWQQGIKASGKEDELRYSRAATIFSHAQAGASMPDNWTLDEAMNEVERATAVQPLPIYASLRAQLLYAQKKYTESCEQFLALNQTNLRSADNFLYAAQCQAILRDTMVVLALQDSAVACFNKPYVEAAAPALLMRTQTLMSLGRYRDAVMDLNDYERLKSKELTANFYYQREQAEMHCRMYQQALSDIERAVRLAPREPLYCAEQAAINYRFGQLDEAVRAAQAAIALDDQFADAHRILGICLREQGNEAAGTAALRRAAELGDEVAAVMLKP